MYVYINHRNSWWSEEKFVLWWCCFWFQSALEKAHLLPTHIGYFSEYLQLCLCCFCFSCSLRVDKTTLICCATKLKRLSSFWVSCMDTDFGANVTASLIILCQTMPWSIWLNASVEVHPINSKFYIKIGRLFWFRVLVILSCSFKIQACGDCMRI